MKNEPKNEAPKLKENTSLNPVHDDVSKHVGCKHLDYDGNYTDCKLIEGPNGWKWWERGEVWTTYDGAPKRVQFCKLRGRINEIFACINPGEMPCYEEQE